MTTKETKSQVLNFKKQTRNTTVFESDEQDLNPLVTSVYIMKPYMTEATRIKITIEEVIN